MEMGLGKRGGLDWIPKICPVKGSNYKARADLLHGCLNLVVHYSMYVFIGKSTRLQEDFLGG